jgi:hypothetical protein
MPRWMDVDICCWLTFIIRFVREKVHPVVRTEEQFLFLCHLVGPFLQRFNTDRPRCVTDLTVELYELLEQVDKNVTHMHYMDPICDLLYPFVLTNFWFNSVAIEYMLIIIDKSYICFSGEFSVWAYLFSLKNSVNLIIQRYITFTLLSHCDWCHV